MDSNDLTRRRVISALGAAGTIALAGCGGDGEDGEDGGDGGDGTDGTDGEDGSDGDGGGDGTDGTDGEDGEDGSDGGETTRPDGTLKIGAIQPTSGPLEFYGKQALNGFYTGLGYKGVDTDNLPGPDAGTGDYEFELGDTTYEVLVRDTQAAAGEARTLAGDLVENEGVDILFGGSSSAAAQSVANNVASRANVPYFAGPAAAASITNSNEYCSDYVFRASETVEMDALSGGKYVAEETDIETVWSFYADYSFGQSVDKFYTRVLENNGVDVVGHTPLPRGYSDDWPGQLSKAEDAGVDAMIGGFTVATLPAMTTTFLANDYSFRFIGGYTTMAGAIALGQVFTQELGELTPEKIDQAGLGPFTTRYHWNQYDNEINTRTNEIHREKYGQHADLFTSGTFAAFSAIDQAVMQSGSTNSDDMLGELTGMTIKETPKGENAYTFQEYNNQARSAMTVSPPIPTQDPDHWSAAIQPGEPEVVFPADETTLPADDEEMNCQL